MSKPESETDPWAKVRTFDVSTYGDCRMERDYYGEIASEQKYQRGEYAWVDEVDAARAAEAAQHQQEMARLRALMLSDEDRIVELLAERDRLKAAAQAVLDNGTCADPDCCKAAIKHEAALVELRAALSGEGTKP